MKTEGERSKKTTQLTHTHALDAHDRRIVNRIQIYVI